MVTGIESIRTKAKNFLKSKFSYDILRNYQKMKFRIFEIFLEDINAFDKELYFFLLKKPNKIVWLLEFILRNLIEKAHKINSYKYDKYDFQIVLLRNIFYSIPNKIEKIEEGEFLSLKAVVNSIGDLKLRNKQKIDRFYTLESDTTRKTDSIIENKKERSLFELKFQNFPETLFFTDYQVVSATGLVNTSLKGQTTINLTLILEKCLVGKLFPGEEIFFSGIPLTNKVSIEKGRQIEHTKTKFKNHVVKILGFSRLNFLNKFNLNDGNGNLDKKFIEFAQSRNIYKWIYSLIIPTFKTSFSFKQALSCLLFGGNKKMLADDFILNGQINILILEQEKMLFSNLENYFKNLISLSYIETVDLENNANKFNKEKFLERIFFSKINRLFYNFKVILIEKFENLDFNEHCLLSNILDTKYFSKHNHSLNHMFSSVSIVAFYDDLLKKNFNKIKIDSPESFILTDTLKKFDLIAVSSEISEEMTNNTTFNANSYFESLPDNYYDYRTIKFKNTSFEFFKNYIGFARENFTPKLSKKASEFIKNAYIFLKISKKKLAGKKVADSYRLGYLETIIKISEAIGKMRMAREIDSTDALEAVRLVQNFTI